eukprot:CAMPEP_0115285540 /NCGR_PEP_ID=MMETSP0270-20121206/61481_1 /TAXON_ID=71861 /ORGANISM="Scrippsiella trochoidea, Strain CCMP3099" /LENGTH=192 /DNA_ID=CAMNT_0002702561 /DNA_START=38 /DNA_END=616 /DNA_ORIENTATION=+
MDLGDDEPPAVSPLENVSRFLQRWVDKTTIHVWPRWTTLALLIVVYGVRVYFVQGFYIVTYGLGIYMLNLLIGFLSPAVDPDTDGPVLPTTDKEEFRPFTRKLPEFKFWLSAFRAVIAAILMTFFPIFDLPVFWPILLAYFILLVCLTLKDRIRHMIQHKYIPISMGKQTYGELTKVKAGGGSGGDGEKDDK